MTRELSDRKLQGNPCLGPVATTTREGPPSSRKSLPLRDKGWKELDSCTSSDALLMNVFCHPTTLANTDLRIILLCSGAAIPEFGFKARVPLFGERTDQTEVDMRWGSVLFESKLMIRRIGLLLTPVFT